MSDGESRTPRVSDVAGETQTQTTERDVEQRERRVDPGPTGGEYERFKRETRLRNQLAGLLLFLVTVLAVLAVVEALAAPERTDAIQVCESNRKVVQALIHSELTNLDNTQAELFPDIPPDVFARLVEARRAEFERLLTESDPRECDQIFG